MTVAPTPLDRRPFIRSTVHLEAVDSTNDLARSLVVDDAHPLPLLVRANVQHRGRGRGDRTWWSDSGSLTFSVAIDSEAQGLRVDHEPRVALATALAIAEVVDRLVPSTQRVGIRWPNDVEVDDRKVAGILPERVDTPLGPRLVIGVGLNLATRLDDAPAEVRAMATSLAVLRDPTSTLVEPEAVLEAILARLDEALKALAGDDPALVERWARLDTLAGRPVRVALGTEILAGTAAGIDLSGALLVQVDGRHVTLHGGRVLRP